MVEILFFSFSEFKFHVQSESHISQTYIYFRHLSVYILPNESFNVKTRKAYLSSYNVWSICTTWVAFVIFWPKPKQMTERGTFVCIDQTWLLGCRSPSLQTSKAYWPVEGFTVIDIAGFLRVNIVTGIDQLTQDWTRNVVVATFRQPFRDMLIDPSW